MTEFLHFIAGPIIGGLIGYFTNFVAIKMLFWPRNEKKIKGHTLPFTPGIIPKRKDKLARAIGEAVAENVFTEDDIKEIFLSDGMAETVAESIVDTLYNEEMDNTPLDLMTEVMDEDERRLFTANLEQNIKHKVDVALYHADIGERVAYESRKIIRDKAISRAMTNDAIENLSNYIGRSMQEYTREHSDSLIMPMINNEIANMLTTPARKLLQDMNADREQVKATVAALYRKFISEYCMEVVKLFDIAGLTEKKIIEFKSEEIEALVNGTIHREMQAVINLGAVIGVIIGLVNSFL